MEEIRVRKGDVIAYTLKRLGVSPQDDAIVMVGDRKHDVIGAGENHIPCVGVLYGYGSREELSEAGADKIVGSVEELGDCLKCMLR